MKTPDITTPTAAEVPALTDRLVAIETEIEILTEEKKGIKARLELFARDQHGEHLADDKREGRKVTLNGTRHRIPVIFTSDLLIKSFKEGSPKHKELRGILAPTGDITKSADEAADEQLKLFFNPPNTWEVKLDDGQKFRAAAAEWLPAPVAAKFVSACTAVDKHGIKKSNTVFDMKAASAVREEAK